MNPSHLPLAAVLCLALCPAGVASHPDDPLAPRADGPAVDANDPYALGLIRKPSWTLPPSLKMAPVNLADLTADYGKDFGAFTHCRAYLSGRKRAPYNPDAPADPVVFTAEQKAEQSAAGAAMLAGIEAAAAAGKKEYVVAAGIYRINRPIRLMHVHDFTLKFDRAEIFQCGERFLETGDALRVNVRGPVSVTLDPKPFTMTRVVSVDRDSAEVTLALMKGWDARNVPAEGGALIFDPHGRLLPARMPAFTNMRVTGDRLVMSINPDNWYVGKPDKGNVTGLCWQFYAPGNIVWIETNPKSQYTILQRENCRDMVYEDIDLHCFRRWLYGFADGNTTFRRIRAIGRPGTSQISGGMCQFMPNRGETRFEECEIQGDCDDQIDVLSHSHMVFAQKSPREVWVKSGRCYHDPFHPGGDISFFDFDYTEARGKAVIVASEAIKDKSLVKRCNAWVEAGCLRHAGESWVYKVTLDRDVAVKPMDMVELADNRTDKLVITDCYFHDGCTRVLIHGTKETVVENSVFERQQLSALQIGAEKYWWEGPNDKRVTVRDCLFVNASNGLVNGRPSIMIGLDAGPEATFRDLTESVLVEGNVIVSPAKQAIRVRNTTRAVVRDNRIIRPASWPRFLSSPSVFGDDFAAIHLYAVGAGEVTGNQIEEPGGNLTAPVIVSETCDKGAIRVESPQRSQPGNHNP